MTAGRELDVLVAEKVFGFKDFRVRNEILVHKVSEPRTVQTIGASYYDDGWRTVRPYSTDIAAAWEVRDWIRSRLFSVRDAFAKELQRVVSSRIELEFPNLIHWSHLLFFIEPVDICLAALKAVGHEVKG